jgi:hypothetical protein
MYQISLWTQNRNFVKYSADFNDERLKIGLKPVSDNWDSAKKTWDDWEELDEWNFDDYQVTKLFKIFSLNNIRTGVIYNNDSSGQNDIFDSKFTLLNSNLLFWKNEISSEMDVYRRTIDSISSERLTIRYYFKDDNGNKDYFEANYYHINENDDIFCGTPALMKRIEQRNSGKPYFGNLTKKQADSILKNWGEY